MLGEAEITVNGAPLTVGQSLTLRVAVSVFLTELSDPVFRQGLGDIAPLYEARLKEIEALIFRAGGT